MKNLKKITKILVLVMLIVTLTGCTKTLQDKDGKAVKNEQTGQTITKNIICKPTDKDTIEIYKENKVKIEKLPECNEMKIVGEYEDLWNTFFVRPLGFIIVKLGELVNSTAISIVIITLLLRGCLYPMTRKSLKQSENMKKAGPEIARIEKGKNGTLIIVNTPDKLEKNSKHKYKTIPLGIIITDTNYLITVTVKENEIINEMIESNIKELDTAKKTRFTIQILLKTAVKYLKYLNMINEEISNKERILYKSTQNKEPGLDIATGGV